MPAGRTVTGVDSKFISLANRAEFYLPPLLLPEDAKPWDCLEEVERWRSSPEVRRAAHLWNQYKLPWAEFQELRAQQENACAICRTLFGDDLKLIHTDHDHACDHPDKGVSSCRACVRGLLCPRCNILLGWIENNRSQLPLALAYLGIAAIEAVHGA